MASDVNDEETAHNREFCQQWLLNNKMFFVKSENILMIGYSELVRLSFLHHSSISSENLIFKFLDYVLFWPQV